MGTSWGGGGERAFAHVVLVLDVHVHIKRHFDVLSKLQYTKKMHIIHEAKN